MATAQVLTHDNWGYGGKGYPQRHFGYDHGYSHGFPPRMMPPPPPPPHDMAPPPMPLPPKNARPDYHPLGREYHFGPSYGKYSGPPPPPPPFGVGMVPPPPPPPPQRRHAAGYSGSNNSSSGNTRRSGSGKAAGQQKWQGQEVHVPSVELLATEVGVDDPRVKTAAWRVVVVEVSFKLRPNGLYWYRAGLKPGEVVLVSADRGFDIGTVVSSKPSETADISLPHTDPSKGQFSIIFRPATPQEVHAYRNVQTTQEAQAVLRVTEILSNLTTPELQDLKFVDAVFQFDGRKLTLYYETSSTDYKNYRPLLKPLFDTFGCRIWLQKLAKKDENANADEGEPSQPEPPTTSLPPSPPPSTSGEPEETAPHDREGSTDYATD